MQQVVTAGQHRSYAPQPVTPPATASIGAGRAASRGLGGSDECLSLNLHRAPSGCRHSCAGHGWLPRSAKFLSKRNHRDGRIYCLQHRGQRRAVRKSGEMGVGITMLAAGPNGEISVIGDNEGAPVYFFKHGLAVAVRSSAPAAAPAFRAHQRSGVRRLLLLRR